MKLNFKQEYVLSMPQLLLGSLAENWLLKKLGDIHWDLFLESLGSTSDSIIDSNYKRLYARFVGLKWPLDQNLFAFKDNDAVSIKANISRFGHKMFFINNGKKITSSLMPVFSSRASGENKKLTEKQPVNSENTTLNVASHFIY